MNKCEWKDGKFEGCDDMGNRGHGLMIEGFSFCPFCGADIRKPEPEKPLIVRSGETWSAHFEGVDYLFISTVWEHEYDPSFFGSLSFDKNDISFNWIPFSEITLNDKIALFRPMVIDRDSIEMLLGIADNIIFCIGYGEPYTSNFDDNRYRLATPHELQEDHIANKQ